jgi:ubiquinone/menaquinone biosynthesis C-methylase UbiE
MEILCCPACKDVLYPVNSSKYDDENFEGFTCRNCGINYGITEGYLDFMGDKELIHSSNREKFIRSVYAKIYTPATNFMFLFCGGVKNARKEVLSKLEIKDNFRILETGMGAGENLLWISTKAENLTLYAIDIQKQMMTHCIGNLKKWNLKAELFRGDAEELPFKDEKFDVVFHLGAINLFSDRKKAIDEMIRVAKPGTKIVIADETDKAGKLFNCFTGSKDRVVPPMDLIPAEMLNKQIEIIWKGFGYVISFIKPWVK